MKEFLRKHFIYILIAVAALPFGAFLCTFGFKTKDELRLSYTDAGSVVDYHVCNKESSSPLIAKCEKRPAYVASLIDYIATNFNYVLGFSSPVSGKLDYQLVATVTASQSGGDKAAVYGDHSYNLGEVKTKEINNMRDISIIEAAQIDYSKYNAILNEFRQQSPSAVGNLRIAMKVTGRLTSEAYPDPVDINTVLSLQLPLAERDVEIAVVKSDNSSGSRELKKEINVDNPFKLILRVFGSLSIALGLAYLLVISYKYFKDSRGSEYEENIKKVLSIYDSIIVSVKNSPDLSASNVIDVNEFDELLDVYNAVHMPINFYRTAKTSKFIVISGDTAWRFVVRESDFAKKEEEKKDEGKKDDGQQGEAKQAEVEQPKPQQEDVKAEELEQSDDEAESKQSKPVSTPGISHFFSRFSSGPNIKPAKPEATHSDAPLQVSVDQSTPPAGQSSTSFENPVEQSIAMGIAHSIEDIEEREQAPDANIAAPSQTSETPAKDKGAIYSEPVNPWHIHKNN